MGSRSDWETMAHAVQTLESLGIAYEARVVSAHPTPDLLFDYAEKAAGRGLKVIIAGAGAVAPLPGMCAAPTPLPILGMPIQTTDITGLASVHSILPPPPRLPRLARA